MLMLMLMRDTDIDGLIAMILMLYDTDINRYQHHASSGSECYTGHDTHDIDI